MLRRTSESHGQCRCCLKYAPVRNMWEQYKDAYTESEVYGKMLVDCFSISWTILEKAEDDKICEDCVTKLRDAIIFKKEVLHSQEALLKIHKANIPEESFEDDPLQNPPVIKVIHERSKSKPKTPKKEKLPQVKIPKPKVQKPPKSITEKKSKKSEFNFVIPVIQDEDTFEIPIMKKNDENLYEIPMVRKKFDHLKFNKTAPVIGKKDQEIQTDHYTRVERSPETIILKEEQENEILVAMGENPNYQDVEYLEEVLEVPENDSDDNQDQPRTKKRRLHKGKKHPIEPLKEATLNQHRDNIRSILITSNATPIRGYWGIGYTCCFCSSQFPTPGELKKHSFTHEDTPFKFKVRNLFEHVVKLDVTALKCNICDENIETLQQLMHHIKEEHQMPMHFDIPNHIMPFKFEGTNLNCAECSTQFDSFKSLTEHMNDIHYRNYECCDPECNRGFVNFQSLKTHSISHGITMVASAICGKVFKNKKETTVHETEHQWNVELKCTYANETFTEDIRIKREEEAQEAKPERVICATCPEMFDSARELLNHVKSAHIEHKYKCTECDKSFFLKQGLKNHMIHAHTQRELRQCPICPKMCPSFKALKDHMLTHSKYNSYKYQCEVCELKFQLEANYMGHMESQHGLTQ